MKHLPIIAASLALLAAPASAEPCLGGGVPGLSRIAQRLKVRPVMASGSALNACDGRAYEIGALLNATLDRIEKLEHDQHTTKEAADGKR